ncbi:efflux transporter outer membrane subunit [Alcanivorax sp. JB21]|uniref:efflux transporter outer membrane subunit n=1 Tax=Alcanivorax limicola TaxID=2874102 RepID=UPI001CBE041F|nr:efflux transporter outer membrane subunit [Alcanivorax limicola]MBZ2189540.1 efflux transporter outer membrane subunit [Alcanivorax limicola]
MRKSLPLIVTVALLGGCAVGPDHATPATPTPDAFHAEHQHGDAALAGDTFWNGFGDPLLAQLITQTLTANQDLQGALARYEQAAALLYGARRDQWPSLHVSGAASEQYLAEVDRLPGGPERTQRYQAGVTASWELDMFGRLRRATESRRAELAAVGADRAALQVALTSELASSYFTLRGLQQQHQVARQNLALQQDSLRIVSARVDAGRDTDFDQVRARAQVARIRAELPALEAGIRSAMHRIAVLTGQPPAALIDILSEPVALPRSVPEIPVATPGDVLRRRPDIAAAEYRLAAATARIGVNTADLFPRFTLSGLMASVAADSSDLFSGPADSRQVALGIDWAFLNQGRVRARIEAAGAESRQALARYQQAVLIALEETETRLDQYQRAQQRTAALEQAAMHATRAAELARTRYERGFIDYFQVLTAEQELTATLDASQQSHTDLTLAMVAVYRALAGAPEPETEIETENETPTL